MRLKDLEFGLLGEQLGHSFSPPSTGSWQAMTTNWWNSHQRRWSPSSDGRFRGLNVTIP